MSADIATLAIDIGGTKTAAALVSDAGTVLAHRRRPTEATRGARAVLDGALALGRELVPVGTPLRAVGIGSAGVIDRYGVVTHATESLPGWVGSRLVDEFTAEFAAPASALNDVHAHGLGEARYGAGAGHQTVLLVAVGTGIGGCLTIAGTPCWGAHGLAGHVGHLPVPEAEGLLCPCGRSGHLEGLASGPATLARFRAAGGRAAHTGEVAEIAGRADDPDAGLAQRVLATSGFALGRVIGGLLNVLDPDVVVLGGGLTGAGAEWSSAVRSGIAHDALDAVSDTPVVPARLSDHAALVGAAAYAWDQEERS